MATSMITMRRTDYAHHVITPGIVRFPGEEPVFGIVTNSPNE
jgi:hypothetical protein